MSKLAQNTQKLLFPQEIEVWVVLPALRKAFAVHLIKAGMPQKKVAQLMGVTEAAVSQYKNGKRAHETAITGELSVEVSKSIPQILKNPKILFQEMMRVNHFIKTSGLFCKIHRLKSQTPDGCENMCAYGGHASTGVHHG